MSSANRSGTLLGPGEIQVQQNTTPTPDHNGIVVAVSACGICGSDMHMWRHPPEDLPLPIVLGHEFSGRVHSVGSGVTGIEPGSRVTANPMHSLLGVGGVPGAFSDYVYIPNAVLGESVFLLPDELSDEDGALVEPLAVALHAIKRARLAPDARVLIMGAGPIGLCVLAALKAGGHSEIIVSDVEELRLSVAKHLGASVCVNPRQNDINEIARQHFGTCEIPYVAPASNADVAFDCAGVPQTFQSAINSVRFGGTVVYVANGPSLQLDPRDLLCREINILGSYSYVDEFPEAISLLQSGSIDLKSMITQRISLDQLSEAFADQANAGKAVKTMVIV